MRAALAVSRPCCARFDYHAELPKRQQPTLVRTSVNLILWSHRNEKILSVSRENLMKGECCTYVGLVTSNVVAGQWPAPNDE